MRTPELVTALFAEFHVGDEFEKKEYICSDVGDCGWRGLGTELKLFFRRNAAWPMCPNCSSPLAYVSEIDAKDHSDSYVAREHRKFIAELKKAQIKNGDSLPDLEGDELEFSWEIEPSSDEELSPDFVVVDCGDVEVLREVAYWGNSDRAKEVKKILKKRYGKKFSDLHCYDPFGYLNAGASPELEQFFKKIDERNPLSEVTIRRRRLRRWAQGVVAFGIVLIAALLWRPEILWSAVTIYVVIGLWQWYLFGKNVGTAIWEIALALPIFIFFGIPIWIAKSLRSKRV